MLTRYLAQKARKILKKVTGYHSQILGSGREKLSIDAGNNTVFIYLKSKKSQTKTLEKDKKYSPDE